MWAQWFEFYNVVAFNVATKGKKVPHRSLKLRNSKDKDLRLVETLLGRMGADMGKGGEEKGGK